MTDEPLTRVREKFDVRLSDELFEMQDKLIAVLQAAVDAKKLYTVQCPKACCKGSKFQAPMPDIATQLKVVQWLTERVEGRPPLQPAKPDPVRASSNLDELSDAELDQLIQELE